MLPKVHQKGIQIIKIVYIGLEIQFDLKVSQLFLLNLSAIQWLKPCLVAPPIYIPILLIYPIGTVV